MKGKYIALILFISFYLWMGFGCDFGAKSHEFYVPMFCLLSIMILMYGLMILLIWLKINWDKKV